jgi:succinate dehydrogenase / fumarate reductase cytochrome b subunit
MAGSILCRFFGSTIGMKVLMALTGVVLFGFTIGHMTGNLLVFAGPAKMNGYAQFLKASPLLLWTARIVLLASVIVHIYASIRLTRLKVDARPVPYGLKQPHGSTYAGRTMMWSGPIIALFVIYHLMHFTFGNVHPTHPNFNPHAVYENVITGFRSWPVSLTYIIAMVALGLHLSHGLWSMLQTVGVNRPQWEKPLRCGAVAFAVLVCGGFIAIPLAVLTRMIT